MAGAFKPILVVIADGTHSLNIATVLFSRVKIRRAFPGILERQYPIVKAHYTLLTVLYLLRMKDVDAVPIIPVTKKGARAVFGFSSLPHFMNLGSKGFADLLRGPCEAASDELVFVSVEDDLASLFEAFESRRLGFALVHDEGKTMKAGLVSLADVLSLYGTGAIRTEMTVREVSTPIFSMDSTTTIRGALRAMFRHRYRRVFLSKEKEYASDRSIMSYLFSPTVLEELGRGGSKDILAAPIARVEKASPIVIGPGTSLKKAALKLEKERGGCCVTGEAKVVTPWDTVMKPWLAGKLTIA